MKEFAVLIILLLAVIAGNSYGYVGFDLSTFFVFIIVVGFLIYRDRRKVKLQGIVFMRRTTKGRNFIDRTANKHKTFWKTLGIIGVIIAVPTLILGSAFLVSQAFTIAGGAKEGGVRLLLPGPVSAPTDVPGAFVVPWWIWVIGVAAVIIPHEFMHGIMCRLDKVRIKSVGWILLVIIPGAFVEPDEKQLQRAKRSTKLKVYAAGSFANILTAFAVLAILVVYFFAAFSPAGVFVQQIPGGPAEQYGIKGTITAIDNYQVRTQDDIRAALSQYQPGDTVYVTTVSGDLVIPSFQLKGADFFIPKSSIVTEVGAQPTVHSVVLSSHPERGGAYMGIVPALPSYSFAGSQSDFFVYQNVSMLMLWIFVFSLGVGIVNILPIKPLDGGALFEEMVGHFTPRTKYIVRGVGSIMLLVLLFNLIGPILV